MTKGVVMEVRKKDCIVLTETGAFVRIRGSGGSIAVGDEITLPEARRSLPRRSWMMGSAAAAAAALMIFVFSVLPGAFPDEPAPAVIFENETVAYISIDINPSIELGIDGKKRVVDVKELNEDGVKLVGELDLLGEQVDAAVRIIVEEAENKLLKDRTSADIVITSVVVAEDAELQEDVLTAGLQAEVRQVLAQHHKEELEAFRVTVWSAPSEVREEAEAQGLSAGKMAFYLKAKADGADVSVEELKSHSIHDVAEKFKEKELLSAAEKFTKEQMKQLLKQEKENNKKNKKANKNGNGNAGKDDDDEDGDDKSGNRNAGQHQDDDGWDDGNGKKNGSKNNGNNGARNNNGNNGRNNEDDGRGFEQTNGGLKKDDQDRDRSKKDGDKKKDKDKDKDKDKGKGDNGKGDKNSGENKGSNQGNGKNNGSRKEEQPKGDREDESNKDDQGRTGTTGDGLNPGKQASVKTPPGQSKPDNRSGNDKGNDKVKGNGNGKGNNDNGKGNGNGNGKDK